jgi:DNA-binding NarL/FixJ family response regulator
MRVLIADPNPLVRGTLRVLFQSSAQFSVCGEAVDSANCIEKCKLLQPDVVVLDQATPQVSGVEFASVLQSVNPGMKIVLFSFCSRQIGRQLASWMGVDVVVSEREGLNRLIQLIADRPGGPPN